MDNAIHVQGKFAKDEEETRAAQVNQLHADIREASQLLEAFTKLENSYEWGTYTRILIEPSIKRERKTIDDLNKHLKDNPNGLSELIFHNAFHEILTTMFDLPKLRKTYADNLVRLRERLKTLTK